MIWKLTFNKWKKMNEKEKKNQQETHQMQWV